MTGWLSIVATPLEDYLIFPKLFPILIPFFFI